MDNTPRIFCTTFGTVIFFYRGERDLAFTPCHMWQVAIQSPEGKIYVAEQSIPCKAQRGPGLYDAESMALLISKGKQDHFRSGL